MQISSADLLNALPLKCRHPPPHLIKEIMTRDENTDECNSIKNNEREIFCERYRMTFPKVLELVSNNYKED